MEASSLLDLLRDSPAASCFSSLSKRMMDMVLLPHPAHSSDVFRGRRAVRL